MKKVENLSLTVLDNGDVFIGTDRMLSGDELETVRKALERSRIRYAVATPPDGVKVPTVEALKQSGYKVRVEYYRYSFDWKLHPAKDWHEVGSVLTLALAKNGRYISTVHIPTMQPKGGVTKVFLSNGGLEGEGVAVCATTDNFVKRIGLRLAIARAMHSMHLLTDRELQVVESQYAK